jgi:hypothetical protein
MKKIFLELAVLLLLITQVKWVSASETSSSNCFVKAEVINVVSETRKLDTGKEDENHYLDLKILEVTKYHACSIEKGQVYRAMDNYPGVLKKGDRINSDISHGCLIRPSGPASFLQWSKMTYDNGSAIRNGSNVIIDSLQSDIKPLHSNH